MAVTDEFENYTGGIFEDHTNATGLDHDISIVGYGVENGVKFWKVRNSWGEHFGEHGFFRIVRGVNNLVIESDCNWATPQDTWTKKEKASGEGYKKSQGEKLEEKIIDNINEYLLPEKMELKLKTHKFVNEIIEPLEAVEEVVTSPLPHELIHPD